MALRAWAARQDTRRKKSRKANTNSYYLKVQTTVLDASTTGSFGNEATDKYITSANSTYLHTEDIRPSTPRWS